MRPNFIKEWQDNNFKHQKGVIFDVLQRFVMENGKYSPIYEDNDEGCFTWTSECGRTHIELSYPLPDVPTYDDKFDVLNNPVRLSRRGHIEVEYFDIKQNRTESIKQSWNKFLKTDGWKQYVEEQEKQGNVVDSNDIILEINTEYVFVPECDSSGKPIISEQLDVFSFSNNGIEDRSETIDFPQKAFFPIYIEQKRQYMLGLLNNKERKKNAVNEMER
ncbi:hypothetical protein ACS91_29845 [Vibrio parahaemolyticus]|uniref:hypothetical protein n=1 Tax=Vibrio parahaemolyticus TaxID=670 RepID=UPI0006A5A864|nr:hypothetical protein ACS91_29845 [Vibrio parahaemolyticus]